MKFTAHSEFRSVLTRNKTLKAQVLACLLKRPMTSFEIEDGLNRLHQSVSSTLTRLLDSGVIRVCDTRQNQYGNWVNVYEIAKKKS